MIFYKVRVEHKKDRTRVLVGKEVLWTTKIIFCYKSLVLSRLTRHTSNDHPQYQRSWRVFYRDPFYMIRHIDINKDINRL